MDDIVYDIECIGEGDRWLDGLDEGGVGGIFFSISFGFIPESLLMRG